MIGIFIAVALTAIVVLGVVFFIGLGRSGRFRQFARDRGGTFARHDDFAIADRIADVFDADDRWVGYSARIDLEPGEAFLFDVHEKADGPPRRTAALVEISPLEEPPAFALREAMPTAGREGRGEPRERYGLVGCNWEELPGGLREALADRPPPDGRPGRDWLLEVKVRGDILYVASRDRPLSFSDEWEALVETLELLRAEL